VTRGLMEIGFSPFANLAGEDVSTKPSNWTGDVKEYPLVNGAHLAGTRMEYVDAIFAFLVNADLHRVNLSHAHLFERQTSRKPTSMELT